MVSPPDFLLSCLGRDPQRARRRQGSALSLAGDSSPQANCVFCDVRPERGFRVVASDESFVAFHDRSPAARVHLLVVPRKHIPNVKSLRPRVPRDKIPPERPGIDLDDDARLVEAMHAFGRKALDLVAKEGGAQNGYGATDPNPDPGRYADESSAVGPRRYGFHIPPFRSVEHLHLHCLQLPFVSPLKALKYRVAAPSASATATATSTATATADAPPRRHKGWSWFVQWRQCADLLDDGGTVKVGPC